MRDDIVKHMKHDSQSTENAESLLACALVLIGPLVMVVPGVLKPARSGFFNLLPVAPFVLAVLVVIPGSEAYLPLLLVLAREAGDNGHAPVYQLKCSEQLALKEGLTREADGALRPRPAAGTNPATSPRDDLGEQHATARHPDHHDDWSLVLK
jgi:hypothetical protein